LKLIPLSTPLPEVAVMAAWKKETLTEPAKQFIAAAKAVPPNSELMAR
jgi:hypothetical protein